jgi:hypothetical protein
MRTELATTTYPLWFGRLSKKLEKSGTGFFVGDSVGGYTGAHTTNDPAATLSFLSPLLCWSAGDYRGPPGSRDAVLDHIWDSRWCAPVCHRALPGAGGDDRASQGPSEDCRVGGVPLMTKVDVREKRFRGAVIGVHVGLGCDRLFNEPCPTGCSYLHEAVHA